MSPSMPDDGGLAVGSPAAFGSTASALLHQKLAQLGAQRHELPELIARLRRPADCLITAQAATRVTGSIAGKSALAC